MIIVETHYLFFLTHLTLTTKEEDIPAGFLMFQQFLPNVFYKTHMKIIHKFQ